MGTILFLFIAGILLLLVEIYLTPGATLFGALGVIALITSNVYAFEYLDGFCQWGFLILSLLITFGFLYMFYELLRSKQFSVQSAIDTKVNVIDETTFVVGEVGRTVTTLRPNGRAEFNGEIVEVFSNGEYIEEHKEVVVYKRTSDKIFVKLNQ